MQKAPGTGELVIIGAEAQKPFIVAGVISGIQTFDSVMFVLIQDLQEPRHGYELHLIAYFS